MQKTQVQSLGQEDPLEKEMANPSSSLAWEIPWTEESGPCMGHIRIRRDLVTKQLDIRKTESMAATFSL